MFSMCLFLLAIEEIVEYTNNSTIHKSWLLYGGEAWVSAVDL